MTFSSAESFSGLPFSSKKAKQKPSQHHSPYKLSATVTTSIMAATTPITAAQILHHTSAFIDDVLSQSDIRRHLVSTLRRQIQPDQNIFKPLNLAAETIEHAISTTSPDTRSSSLHLAEKLLRSYSDNVFSVFLYSLVNGLQQGQIKAAFSLLDVFCYDPLLARSEIAPTLFEDLFLLHLVPVLQGFNDCRSRILSSVPPDIQNRRLRRNNTKLLSGVSKDQGEKLKELERDYEEVLNDNCKVFAGYLKEVLDNRDENRSITPPPLIMTRFSTEGELDFDAENKFNSGETEMSNRRYNVSLYFFIISSMFLVLI